MVAKVSAGVMTSDPAGRSSSATARKVADEPEFTMIPCRLAKRAATRSCISRTCLPIWVELRSTAVTAAISSSPWTVWP